MARCVASLKPGGVICLKENEATEEGFVVDKDVFSFVPLHVSAAILLPLRIAV